MNRTFVSQLAEGSGREIAVRGWIQRFRELSRTSFIILEDCTGLVQCVAPTEALHDLHLKPDDTIEIRGRVRAEPRSRASFEIDIDQVIPLNRAGDMLPFNSGSDISGVSQEIVLDYRPLSLRTESVRDIFRVQASILKYFREFLDRNYFTEIVTSKIVAGGTEGGTNLFAINYFDRVAYLAQSPQFYKEYGVAGLERVYEAGHVYRAEPHATSRHLTEYYSLDLEMGFIDGPEDVIQLERELLTYIFNEINTRHADILARRGLSPLPSMLGVPTWEFDDCLERLRSAFGRADLADDLDPQGERELCVLAERENGIPAVFVIGYPLRSRPFYTRPRGDSGAASFDLLFRGLEITTGGERLHNRESLERALIGRGLAPEAFETHLRMFDLGMPPHGGLAIGLERLTMQILGLTNVREATMYPRDRHRLTP
ncbi:MAG: aspartate--tRNA(Asn) ligase [Chlorobi bacterium]|nr:aspartate--tRNA(Asn) ligase [Chlorobiota bacterium]